jgi:methionyl-tRNA formyltransferase
MKIILMGTPDFIVPIFDEIANAHDVVAVFTRAPKPAGRKRVITKTPAHVWAESRGIPVHVSIRDFDDVASLYSEFAVIVAAYGVILKENVLKYNPINIHPSLLPKYRGPTPVETAILNGETESGACLMKMTAEVDAGDMLACEKFPIDTNDNAADVYKKVSNIAQRMVLEYLAAPKKYPPAPQKGDPTFSRKFSADTEAIDWNKTPAEIHNQVRAIGGRTIVNGIDVKILETEIENGALKIKILQPAGKKPMKWADFMNGQRGRCLIAPCRPQKAYGFRMEIGKDGKVQNNS